MQIVISDSYFLSYFTDAKTYQMEEIYIRVLFFFLSTLCGMWDLISLNTWAPCSGSLESKPLYHQGSPYIRFSYLALLFVLKDIFISNPIYIYKLLLLFISAFGQFWRNKRKNLEFLWYHYNKNEDIWRWRHPFGILPVWGDPRDCHHASGSPFSCFGRKQQSLILLPRTCVCLPRLGW